MASDAWRLQLSVVVTAAVVAVLAAPVAVLAAPVPAGALFGTASVFTATANARLLQVTLTAQPPIGVDPLLDPRHRRVRAGPPDLCSAGPPQPRPLDRLDLREAVRTARDPGRPRPGDHQGGQPGQRLPGDRGRNARRPHARLSDDATGGASP